ncbi:TM2 domain-containing protein [SAR202 cluster bacterium AD-804-J14_MRT_500m]|nr:TM2 domain-containing protein [SAR202 cluster bacterium AD-804-J14_MRT_500m]
MALSGSNKLCTNCRKEVTAGSRFCIHCGESIPDISQPCIKCQQEVPAGSKFCPHCGETILDSSTGRRSKGPDEKYCSSCGELIKEQAEVCVKCGVRVSRTVNRDTNTLGQEFSTRSRLVAGLLGILLGGFGVHRFYLGNIGIGIIQIVVSLITLGIGGLWGLVEGIVIVAGADWKDADGRPLKK